MNRKTALLAMMGCVALTGCRSGIASQPGPARGDASFAKPGFVAKEKEGRLWVFREGSKELAAFEKHGEPAKQVVRPGVGPLGMTLKGPDTETILAYVAAKPGFVTKVNDGRIWVFREGSEELVAFEKHGEPAKQVVRPGAGPLGATLKGPDAETLALYMVAR